LSALAITIPKEVTRNSLDQVSIAASHALPADETSPSDDSSFGELEKHIQRQRHQQQEQLRGVAMQLSPRPKQSQPLDVLSPMTNKVADEYRTLRRSLSGVSSARSQLSFGNPFSPQSPSSSPGFGNDNEDFFKCVQGMNNDLSIT